MKKNDVDIWVWSTPWPTFFLHSKPNYSQEVLTWSLEVPQLGGSVVDFKDPVAGGSFSPAVNSHELPVFKSFHGVVKKPEGRTIKHRFICSLSSQHHDQWSFQIHLHVCLKTGGYVHPGHHWLVDPNMYYSLFYHREPGLGWPCNRKSRRHHHWRIREIRLRLYHKKDCSTCWRCGAAGTPYPADGNVDCCSRIGSRLLPYNSTISSYILTREMWRHMSTQRTTCECSQQLYLKQSEAGSNSNVLQQW